MNCAAIKRPPRLIIGIGNPWRGDDGAGPRVVERLRERMHVTRAGQLRSTHQLVPELAIDLSQVSLVQFIDAHAAMPVGRIGLQRVVPSLRPTALGHQLAPGELLSLTEQAFGRCPRAWVYSIGGACWDLDAPVSEPVAAAVERLVDRLVRGLQAESRRRADRS